MREELKEVNEKGLIEPGMIAVIAQNVSTCQPISEEDAVRGLSILSWVQGALLLPSVMYWAAKHKDPQIMKAYRHILSEEMCVSCLLGDMTLARKTLKEVGAWSDDPKNAEVVAHQTVLFMVTRLAMRFDETEGEQVGDVTPEPAGAGVDINVGKKRTLH